MEKNEAARSARDEANLKKWPEVRQCNEVHFSPAVFCAGLHRDGDLLLHVAGGFVCLGQSSVRRQGGDGPRRSAPAHVCV